MASKSFSDANNSSDIEEEIIKEIKMLKPFNMVPCKAIPEKPFISEEENNCKEINLTPQDRIGNINWCKYSYVNVNYKVTFAERVSCRDTNKIPDENSKVM